MVQILEVPNKVLEFGPTFVWEAHGTNLSRAWQFRQSEKLAEAS